MILKSSKINEFRLWGLLLTMFGLGLMIVGSIGIVYDWGLVGRIFAAVFLVLGLISILGSMAVYFWAGMMSTSAVSIRCPECNRMTKMIGKTDRCMFCKTILSTDPQHAPSDEELLESEQSDPSAMTTSEAHSESKDRG
ncbi:DUF2614 family zinc ribbon-containing protein [Paenibacillus senegalensis]|uniref:DUF2614 family zinc ribbon-containing protein n=1 Tax=Paenibacillus senegalensis TaxID=1465766 RepID=UPI00028953B3|nr:DUF2614 family zinc ribbon-containing protein [Paenibacillus senegalensis]